MDRCSLCPNVNKCLPPHGMPDCDILFIGETPGKDENRLGQVFAGKTGREVDDHYLPLAGLARHRVIITNAIACAPNTPGHKLDPKSAKHQALLQSCANRRLYPVIERSQFKLLVPLGSFACKAVCPDVDLELQHGTIVETDWGIPAFPMYHPALGMHSPKQMLYIRNDWIRLRRYLKGTLHEPVDEYLEPDYAEVTDPDEIDSLDPTVPMACDTESSRSQGAYFLTYSQAPGVGRLIRASRGDLLSSFQAVLSRWESVVLWHNWFYDAKPVAELRLSFPQHVIHDTMLLAFHLGNIPQGLKALAFRLLGMRMQDFEDLVIPYSTAQVLDYYRRAQALDWPKPEEQLERDSKTGLWKLYKPQGMNTKLKRFFTDYRKNPDKDPIAMWDNWESSHLMIEQELGPWPGLDIAHVPFEQALYYSCRDSDALIRLWPLIERMRAAVAAGLPQEEWGIAA